MGNGRVWLFRGLVVVAAAFLVVTWFMPWWRADCAELSANAVVIRPWGLEEDLGFMAFRVEEARMPDWFAPFAFSYLAVALLALLYSLFAPDKELKLWKFKFSLPTALVGLVGLSYIGVAVIGIIVIVLRMGQFMGGTIPLNGHMTIPLESGALEGHITTGLEPGYYLTYPAGAILVILALLRSKVLGKSERPPAQVAQPRPAALAGR